MIYTGRRGADKGVFFVNIGIRLTVIWAVLCEIEIAEERIVDYLSKK
jgi:hypothetical protein